MSIVAGNWDRSSGGVDGGMLGSGMGSGMGSRMGKGNGSEDRYVEGDLMSSIRRRRGNILNLKQTFHIIEFHMNKINRK